MKDQGPEPTIRGSVLHALTAAEFRRRFRWLIFHTWNIPPIFGLGFILLIGVLTPAQILGILITPLEPAYILGWLAFALWFLPRTMRPLADWLDNKPGSSPEQAVRAVRRFPLVFWATFLIYLVLAPASVILAAEFYTGFVATPYDWFRIELVALIVSIIVGLPIFFLIFDLFGLALGGVELKSPIVTVKTKVFLIGALVPLLIDTILVQYYWTRTGYFTFETFGVWLLLEALAIGGSLIFAHSFGQSLSPLQRLIGAPRPLPDEHVAALRPRSTDELGQLTADYRLLLDELQLRREILELNNQLLRSAGSDAGTSEVFTAVVELCRQTIGADQSFLIVHDPHSNTLVGVAQTGVAYRPEGYYRLGLDEQSLAVWAYIHRQTAVAEEAPHDPRVSPQLCARFGIRSAMATPLKLGDEMLGVLMVAHTANSRVYDDRERSLIEGLAREAALALQTQHLRRAREQAEAERLEQAEQVHTLMDATEEGVYGADSSGLCTFVNRAALRMLGYRQPADLLGRKLHELIHHTFPDGRPYPKEQCRVRLAMLTGDTAHADDEVHWRADGTSFPVEYWSHPIVREGRTVGTVVSFIDISERKQVENTLRESEARLRNVLEVTGEGIWDWDLATNVVRHNKRWCKLLGLGEESLQHPATEFAACLHDDDRAVVTARIEACLKGNGPYRSEHRMRRADGQIIWVQDRGDVVERDARGRALRLVGSFADITAQRQAAQVLMESEARFRSIIEASPVPFALNDDDQNITYLNPAFIATFGYTRDDIPTLADWWPRAYPDAAYRQWVATEWAARLMRARQQGAAFEPMEFEIRGKDGSLHSVLASAASLGQTFAGTHLVILYDITARKQAEQALREKEHLLSESQQIGRIGSWSWIPGTTPIYWSEETYRIYGVSPDSFVPDIQGLLGLLHPEDRAAMQAWIADFASGHAPPELEFRVILPSGKVRVLSGRGNLQRDAAGRVRMVGTVQDITERRQAEKSLRTSEERLRTILETEPECVKVLAADGTLLEINPAGLAMIEADTLAQVKGQKMANLIPREHRAAFIELNRRVSEKGESGRLEFEIVGLKGTRRWLETNAVPLRDDVTGETRLLGVTRDVTDRKRMDLDLQDKVMELEQSEDIQKRLVAQAHQEQARMSSLLSAMNIGILFEDVDSRVIYFNPAFRRIWLIPDTIDLAGRTTRDVMVLSANVLARPDHFSKHVLHVLDTHEVSDTFEIVLADGRVVTQLSYPVRDNEGRFIGRLWIYEDITRERQTAEQLIYLAERDSLTGLYNRHRFQEELARMLADVERRQSYGALLFFDLDEFKYINDTFGHRAGDSMLIRVAGEVHALVRRNEVISRIGGDEFAVLLPDANETEATHLAERIIRAISQIPFRYEGQNLRLTTSLGIALYPQHGANAEELVSHADAAMYQAKESGKNTWRVYRHDLDDSREMLYRLSWNDRLSDALERDLLRLHFQGVYHAVDGSLAHVEALVRMQDDTDADRVIMPGHFIPAAEKTGMILDIDRWVIRESIALLKRVPNLPAIAVNISGRSFDEPTLPRYIAEQLAAQAVQPSRLMVELTETSAVSDLHDAQRFIEALRQTGCRVCLDDFGTGFSSFAYLKHLKADILKIDGLFIRDLPNDHDNQVFVKSIVDVARGMNKITVAEFVEDAETLAMLKAFGVDMVQGYHLDMPRANHPALDL